MPKPQTPAEAVAELGAAARRLSKALEAFGANMARANELIVAGAKRAHLASKFTHSPNTLYTLNGEPMREPVYTTRNHVGSPALAVTVGDAFVIIDGTANLQTVNPAPFEEALNELFHELERKLQSEQ
jgi:hypothetical protein